MVASMVLWNATSLALTASMPSSSKSGKHSMPNNPETTIDDDAGDERSEFYDEVDEHEACPVCGGSGVDDSQCACGDDTCCCLVPTPLICSWCEGEG